MLRMYRTIMATCQCQFPSFTPVSVSLKRFCTHEVVVVDHQRKCLLVSQLKQHVTKTNGNTIAQHLSKLGRATLVVAVPTTHEFGATSNISTCCGLSAASLLRYVVRNVRKMRREFWVAQLSDPYTFCQSLIHDHAQTTEKKRNTKHQTEMQIDKQVTMRSKSRTQTKNTIVTGKNHGPS